MKKNITPLHLMLVLQKELFSHHCSMQSVQNTSPDMVVPGTKLNRTGTISIKGSLGWQSTRTTPLDYVANTTLIMSDSVHTTVWYKHSLSSWVLSVFI